jgi:Tfp pilus assembly protein PilE
MNEMNYAVALIGILIFILVASSKFMSFENKISALKAKIDQQAELIEELKDQNTYQDMIINKLNADYNLKNGIK